MEFSGMDPYVSFLPDTAIRHTVQFECDYFLAGINTERYICIRKRLYVEVQSEDVIMPVLKESVKVG